MNNLVVKKGTVLLFSLILLLSASEIINAQVTIREEVKIQSRNPDLVTIPDKQKLAEAGAYYYPIIRDIGFGKYLVLKSGELKFYFDQAETYGINGAEEHTIFYELKSVTGVRSGSIPLYDIMGTPITIRELANKGGGATSCTDSRNFFESVLNYGVGAFEDTWIERGNTEANYGGENSMLSFGLTDELQPDSAGASMFMKFGIGELSSNATLEEASLILQTSNNNADQIGSFNIYRAGGVWNEMTLTYSNRPIPEVSDFITATEADTAENEIKYIYDVDITPFVNEWIAGQADDYGIEIASFTGHTFASSESFFRASPTIDLSFINNESLGSKIANLGFVEAGDTLEIDFQDFNKGLFANFNANDAGIEADDQLIFSKSSNCRNSRVSILPFIEDATEDRYFEFVSNLETNIPIDSTGGVFSEFLEPKLLYDNESVQGLSIFNQSFMEIYDTPFVENSNGNSVPLASFFDPEEFEFTPFAPLGAFTPGAVLRVLNKPENEGLSFKIRIAGWMIKGLSAGKLATAPVENELLAMLMDTGNNVVLSNVDDPNCSFPTDVITENIFTNCFEFTIGGKDRLFVEAEPDSIYPGEASVLTAKLITAQGDTVDFPSDQNFEVSIDEEFRDLGSLLSATNDTADVITNIGPVFGFLSDAPVDEATTISVIVVTTHDSEEISSSVSLAITPNIRIIADEELDDELWPYLPDQNNGQSRGDDRPGYNPLDRTVSVKVLNGLIPVPNEEVELFIEYTAGSGGHVHVNPLPDNDKGTFWADGQTGNRVRIQADDQGIARIDSFRTSPFSGDFIMTSRLTRDTTIFYNEDLVVRVPDLINFANEPTNNRWRLRGANENHNDNHWMENNGMNDLIRALNEFYIWSISTENPDSTAISLGINDISLTWGGSFEYNGDWNTNNLHSFHRVGLSVDIDQRYPVNGVFRALSELQRERLTDIMARFGAQPFDEETIHYGFNGEN